MDGAGDRVVVARCLETGSKADAAVKNDRWEFSVKGSGPDPSNCCPQLTRQQLVEDVLLFHARNYLLYTFYGILFILKHWIIIERQTLIDSFSQSNSLRGSLCGVCVVGGERRAATAVHVRVILPSPAPSDMLRSQGSLLRACSDADHIRDGM